MIKFETHVMNLNDIQFGNIRGASADKPFGIIVYGDLGMEDAFKLNKQILEDQEMANMARDLLIACGCDTWEEFGEAWMRMTEEHSKYKDVANRLDESIERCKRNEGSKHFIDFLLSELQKIRKGNDKIL